MNWEINIQRKVIKNSLLMIMLLVCYSSIIAQQLPTNLNSYSEIVHILSESDNMYGNNFIDVKLDVNTNNVLILKFINTINDTLILKTSFRLEQISHQSYILFCVSDTINRPQTQAFDFTDENDYTYTHEYLNYIDHNGLLGYKYVVLSNNGAVEILPSDSLSLQLSDFPYFKEKYMFVKLQTIFIINDKLYMVQKETNSIYMP